VNILQGNTLLEERMLRSEELKGDTSKTENDRLKIEVSASKVKND